MATKRRALVLQGGGALGAYECGVIKALYQHYPGFDLDVVSGVSIGAITAAVLVGAKADPVRTLEEMWRDRFAVPDWPLVSQEMQLYASAMVGTPGMSRIRPDFLLAPLMATSIYDTSPLRRTLEDLVDLDRVNSSPTHLNVTAVDIETGELTVFDNRHPQEPFSLEMVLASGSIAPNFPATSAKNQSTGKEGSFVDGGLGSNLPLSQAINLLEQADGGDPRVERELIVVELYPMQSRVPATLLEVQNRVLQLIFSSKLKLDRKLFDKINSYVDLVEQIDKVLPQDSELRKHPAYRDLTDHRKIDSFIVITSTRPEAVTGSGNFSRATIEDRIKYGYQDTFARLDELGLVSGNPLRSSEAVPKGARR